MPPACSSERRALAQCTAVSTVKDLRAMTWTDRHAYYDYMRTCAQNDLECDRLLGQLHLQRPAEFVAFVLSFVRELMGADELIEGQNLKRRTNLDDVAIPLANGDLSSRPWVGPPSWSGGLWTSSGKTPGPYQTTLEDWWGAMAIRHKESTWKGAKKQAMITRWAIKGTKTGHATKTDTKHGSKTDRDTA